MRVVRLERRGDTIESMLSPPDTTFDFWLSFVEAQRGSWIKKNRFYSWTVVEKKRTDTFLIRY